jgi:hypothetical protein
MFKAWPMCRLPVTFGGGIITVNGVPGAAGSASKAADRSQRSKTRDSTFSG